jgi:hypothetical protein
MSRLKDAVLFGAILAIAVPCFIELSKKQQESWKEEARKWEDKIAYNAVETAKQRYLATHPEALGNPVNVKDILPFLVVKNEPATEATLAYSRPLGVYTKTFVPEEIPKPRYSNTNDFIDITQILLLSQ